MRTFRPCLAFNAPKNPVTTMADMVVNQSLLGQAFVGSATVIGGLLGATTMALLLSNPAGSTVRAVVDRITVSWNNTTLANPVHLRLDATISSGLTAITPVSLNPASGISAQCTASAGGNVTFSSAGAVLHREILNVTARVSPVAVVWPPDHSLDADFLFSTLTTAPTGALTIRWYEIPLSGGFAP